MADLVPAQAESAANIDGGMDLPFAIVIPQGQ